MQPEFRLGNIREDLLARLCSESSLLGSMGRSRFVELSKQDQRLSALSRPHACMGSVYADDRLLRVWRDVFPLAALQPPLSS